MSQGRSVEGWLYQPELVKNALKLKMKDCLANDCVCKRADDPGRAFCIYFWPIAKRLQDEWEISHPPEAYV